MKNIVRLAERFARNAHNDQYRRDGTTPYFVHPQRVAKLVKESGGTQNQIALAYMHDVIEEWEGKQAEISDKVKNEFGEQFLQFLLLLTRKEDMNYLNYLKRIKKSKSRETVILVKICDIADNLSDDPTEKQKKKYIKGLIELIR